MTLPNILLSGGPRTLLNDLEKADDAVSFALERMREVTPHPRDYVRTEDWEQAQTEHFARCAALERIIDDLREIKGHLILGGVR